MNGACKADSFAIARDEVKVFLSRDGYVLRDGALAGKGKPCLDEAIVVHTANIGHLDISFVSHLAISHLGVLDGNITGLADPKSDKAGAGLLREEKKRKKKKRENRSCVNQARLARLNDWYGLRWGWGWGGGGGKNAPPPPPKFFAQSAGLYLSPSCCLCCADFQKYFDLLQLQKARKKRAKLSCQMFSHTAWNGVAILRGVQSEY